MEFLVSTATLVLLSLLAPSAGQEVNTTFPLTYCTRAAEGGEQVCSPDKLRQLQAITRNDVSNLLRINPLVTTGSSAPMELQCWSTVMRMLYCVI